MATSKNKNKAVIQNILSVASGQLENLIVTKKGVIYFREKSKPKKNV